MLLFLSLSYVYADTKCDAKSAIDGALDMILKQNVDVIFGAFCSACMYNVLVVIMVSLNSLPFFVSCH